MEACLKLGGREEAAADVLPPSAVSAGAALASRRVFDALGGENLTHSEFYWDKDPPYNQSSCKCDGCHPDDLGYAAMAAAVAKTLRQFEFTHAHALALPV